MQLTINACLLTLVALLGCSENTTTETVTDAAMDAGTDMETMPISALEIEPDHYELPLVPAGTTVDTTVALTSVGTDTVQLTAISHDLDHPGVQILWAYGDRGRSLVGIDNMGQDNFTYPVEIDAGVTFRLIIEYRANEAPPPSGTVTVVGDFAGSPLLIPVQAIENAGAINVSPSNLDFGRVRGGTVATQQITVSNSGGATLNLRRIQLDDISTVDFTVSHDGEDATGMPEFLTDPDNDGEAGLAPGGSFILDVQYAPNTEGTDRSTISIDSDDPLQPEVSIAIVGNTDLGCAEISPEMVDIEVPLGSTETIEVTVASCSVSPLTIDRMRMRPGSPPEFVITPESLPEFPAQLTRSDDPIVAQVVFTPSVARRYLGNVQVQTNDPDFATVAIPINIYTPCADHPECAPGFVCLDRECVEMSME